MRDSHCVPTLILAAQCVDVSWQGAKDVKSVFLTAWHDHSPLKPILMKFSGTLLTLPHLLLSHKSKEMCVTVYIYYQQMLAVKNVTYKSNLFKYKRLRIQQPYTMWLILPLLIFICLQATFWSVSFHVSDSEEIKRVIWTLFCLPCLCCHSYI